MYVYATWSLSVSCLRYLVCVDSRASCFALALVRVSHSAFDMDQVLTVINPELMDIRWDWS